jgi:hypothetical protein
VAADSDTVAYTDALAAEVRRVYAYWLSRSDAADVPLMSVIVIGVYAEHTASALREKVADILPVKVADIWRGVFDVTRYVPPITRENSLEYASAAGLAL